MTSRFSLNRRSVLRGIGTGLSLPLLDIMQPAARASLAGGAAAGANAANVRMACLFFANGAIMPEWKPTGEGRDFQFSKSLEPLEAFRDDLNILGGLAQHHARANGDGAGDHARNASAFLTGAQPRKTSGADISVGISIDQAVAAQVGSQTRLPSIELGIDRGRNAGSCDSGYSCAYSSNISWKSASTPCSKEVNPRAAFERLFGSPETAADMERRIRNRKSILDFVADDARRLNRNLGSSDRQKLDEYFTSVREIEERVARAASGPKEIPELALPEGVPAELPEHMRLMFDIIVLAFQTNCTRVATLMIADAGSNRTYPEIGVKNGHHELSHHRNDEEMMKQIAKIDRYLVEQFAYFLQRMKSVREGDRTLLDNSMILYGSAIADGNRHNHHDLPIILAGKGGGSIETGRHIVMKEETPLNNLFLGMSQRMGVSIDRLGDSTGILEL
ncbi:MAG: DUF1552 domain-containing protein [Planctomycetaceae bacterium]|nr:DUF1552 domain-containing protein [Planctomycetaceae bacterium]